MLMLSGSNLCMKRPIWKDLENEAESKQSLDKSKGDVTKMLSARGLTRYTSDLNLLMQMQQKLVRHQSWRGLSFTPEVQCRNTRSFSRIVLARALFTEPDLLLFDEPTASSEYLIYIVDSLLLLPHPNANKPLLCRTIFISMLCYG
uniref:ABC transporter domain-containing protein n=1 Tax=Aegilops tauschii subsp. strangulata TaxID=200361 RepID=A0A453Q5L9_AEGTS